MSTFCPVGRVAVTWQDVTLAWNQSRSEGDLIAHKLEYSLKKVISLARYGLICACGCINFYLVSPFSSTTVVLARCCIFVLSGVDWRCQRHARKVPSSFLIQSLRGVIWSWESPILAIVKSTSIPFASNRALLSWTSCCLPLSTSGSVRGFVSLSWFPRPLVVVKGRWCWPSCSMGRLGIRSAMEKQREEQVQL